MRPLLQLIRPFRSIAMLAGAVAVVAGLDTVAEPAQADEQICDKWGSTTIQGRYVVQNNVWGTDEPQCINVTDTGFQITQADGSVPTDGAPKSYPSIYNGCHYSNCSPGTNLPAQLSSISGAPSSAGFAYVDNAVFNAAYDIWLDPEPKTDGASQTEIMIWFNRVGPIQPIGSQIGTEDVGGRTWEVWTGNNGINDVISFVAPSAIDQWSFDAADFIASAVAHGLADESWYLTSVQAGFEPWENGAGLGLTSFESSLDTTAR